MSPGTPPLAAWSYHERRIIAWLRAPQHQGQSLQQVLDSAHRRHPSWTTEEVTRLWRVSQTLREAASTARSVVVASAVAGPVAAGVPLTTLLTPLPIAGGTVGVTYYFTARLENGLVIRASAVFNAPAGSTVQQIDEAVRHAIVSGQYQFPNQTYRIAALSGEIASLTPYARDRGMALHP